MQLALTKASSHPLHVPDELAFEFDMFVLPEQFGSDPHGYWKAVQQTYPSIFWTPAHGGHWVALRGEDIKFIQSTSEQFSSAGEFIPRDKMPQRLVPVHLDPPEHGPFRALIQPFFLPKALADLEKKARQIAIEIIERLRPRGECEFVSEFSSVMPVMAFLQLAGLPVEDLEMLRGWGEMTIPPTNPQAAEGWANFDRYVRKWIAKFKEEPGEGLFSAVVHAEIDGKPLADEDVYSICYLAVIGGLDTVMLMTSFVARHLAEHPEDRKYILEHPERLSAIVEEFARRYGVSNLAREVRADLIYKDIQMRKGEQILMPFPLFGLDERIYADPMTVDFTRVSSRHTAFGTGAHSCPGAMLARREISIFLEEWLKRIPDFWIKPGTAPTCGVGIVNTIHDLHLQWAP
ncbi:cytochrome P450 [Pseudomonas citronellolis]|uniref:cytochrome P450 n=1 Tax=Pseudomonas citronellolis TaxID=53408 RepID=UPI0021C0317D|nr:cytochrome P450 [Pseudomonas citronellolis]UXJ50298.1 cytochrome P450 [Pseudomonas citronellolis]